MTGLILEGIRASILPCSLALLIPGVLIAISRDPLALLTFVASSSFAIWLRIEGVGIPTPGLALVGGLAFTATFIIERTPSAVHGLIAGFAAALFWLPCVGPELGPLLSTAAVDGIEMSTLPRTLGYVGAVTAPTWFIGLVPLASEISYDKVRRPTRWVGVGLGLLMTFGLFADVVSWLLSISSI